MSTKDEMLFKIETADRNLELGIAALGLLIEEDCHTILEQLDFLCGEEAFCFRKSISNIPPNSELPRRYRLKHVFEYMKSESDKLKIQEDFFKMLLSNLIKETYEAINHYCKTSEQKDLFKSQSWYHFVRIIRNCLSHNYMIEISDKDLKNLPVEWRSITITKEMNNGYLEFSFLGVIQVLELVKEMKEFAENTLT